MDADVPEIDVAELAARHAQGAPVIDVREPDEYESGHVPGATLVPLGTVPDRLDAVPADGTVYVICAKGGRSRRAAEFYRSQGIDAVNVAGGTTAWIDAGQPVSTGVDP
jgi:rhodanese-related sulfurtransferase